MPSRAVRLPSGTAVEAFAWSQAPGGAPRRPTRVAGSSPADAAREAADTTAANERLAALERDAFVKGYSQGERSGLEAAARQGEASLRRLAETIDEMGSLRADLLRRSERELVRLAVSIAERVIRREIALDPSLIAAMAKVAIDRIGDNASAETMAIDESVPHPRNARCIGHVVKVALWVGHFLIDGRGNNLMLHRKASSGCLKRTSR